MKKFNENLAEIQKYVEKLAASGRVKSFRPEAVSRELGLPLEIVMIELLKIKEEGKIKLNYEVRCLPHLDTLTKVDSGEEIVGKREFCAKCGKDIEITLKNLYPIFNITDEYKEFLKKNK